MKKLNKSHIIELFSKDGYKLLEEYKNSYTKFLVECPKSHQFRVTYNNFYYAKSRCPECAILAQAIRQKIPYEIMLKELEGMVVLTTKEEYETNHKKALKIKVLCSCGRIRISDRHSLMDHKFCTKCKKGAEIKKIPYSTVKEKIEEKGYQLISETYVNSKTKLTIKCKIHGEFYIKYNDFQGGHGCPACGLEKTREINKSNRVPLEVIKEKIESKKGQLITTEYLNTRQKLSVKCEKGHLFKMCWGHIRNNHWCPKCKRLTSKPEKEVVEYIKSISNCTIDINNRAVLPSKQELDIWIPDFNLGIEIDGLYWHSELHNPDIKKNVKKKMAAIKDANINFIGIYQDEWSDPIKKEIIKSMIANKIGKAKTKYYAKDTNLVGVSKQKAKEFMELNHLEGHVPFTRAIGLEDGQSNLIMCITLRISKGNVLELARMASLKYTSVVGGASKLLSSITEPLMSYSDNRISKGNVYDKLGFKEITQTFEPSYFYTDFKKRVFRTKCKKLKDFPTEGTERDQALAGAFCKHFGHSKPVYRIYDYGQRKWLRSNGT